MLYLTLIPNMSVGAWGLLVASLLASVVLCVYAVVVTLSRWRNGTDDRDARLLLGEEDDEDYWIIG